jgi:hypothetical protein
MKDSSEKAEIADIYYCLIQELECNSNMNWVCFQDYCDQVKPEVSKLKAFLEAKGTEPEEWGDDADQAFCLISTMIDGHPKEMPCSDDGRYAALGRVLQSLGVLSIEKHDMNNGEYIIERRHKHLVDKWRVMGRFTEGSPYRDGRSIGEKTMQDELVSCRIEWSDYELRVRCPDGKIITERTKEAQL